MRNAQAALAKPMDVRRKIVQTVADGTALVTTQDQVHEHGRVIVTRAGTALVLALSRQHPTEPWQLLAEIPEVQLESPGQGVTNLWDVERTTCWTLAPARAGKGG